MHDEATVVQKLAVSPSHVPLLDSLCVVLDHRVPHGFRGTGALEVEQVGHFLLLDGIYDRLSRIWHNRIASEILPPGRSWNRMRIKRAVVTGLFGMFNHVIPFNLSERITIIHGSNGLGKTVILRMINGLFNSHYSDFRSIPFNKFTIDFDDGASVEIRTKREKSEESKRSETKLEIEYSVPGELPRIGMLSPPLRPEEIGFPLHYLEEVIPELTRVGRNMWRYGPGGELVTFDEIIETFGDYLPSHMRGQLPLFEAVSRSEEAWIKEVKERVDVRYIETQRLVAPSRPARRRKSETSPTPAVARYSNELAELIKAKLGEYASLSQELDQSFPLRVLNLSPKSPPSSDELRAKLASLEEKMVRLRAAGLLDKEQSPNFGPQPPITDDPTKANVLSVFADDVEKKLSVFDEITGKIELLKHFVRDHFLNKELSVNKERGFVLTSTRTREELSPTLLSSGEQHELVLFYELLFRLKPNSLILIDEPEISLHPDWQLQFLSDLQQIIKLSSFDALIATHSPLIINQRWDLTVELEAEG